MVWIDDDIERKSRHKVGRPTENPFPSTKMEEDFVVRGRRVLELYYVDDPASKTNLHFEETKQLSKTSFWSFLFIYYLNEKHIRNNVQGFYQAVVKHFGKSVTPDRGSIAKCVQKFNVYNVHHKYSISNRMSMADQRAQEKYRHQYQYVVELWEKIDID